jgi:hypothetical protein
MALPLSADWDRLHSETVPNSKRSSSAMLVAGLMFTPRLSECLNARFCSGRCREWFDNGNPPHDPNHLRRITEVPLASWRIVAGPPGVEIGSLYYAPILGHALHKAAAAATDGPIRPRRLCERCGARLPVWVAGRRVRTDRKFCQRCAPKPRKKVTAVAR